MLSANEESFIQENLLNPSENGKSLRHPSNNPLPADAPPARASGSQKPWQVLFCRRVSSRSGSECLNHRPRAAPSSQRGRLPRLPSFPELCFRGFIPVPSENSRAPSFSQPPFIPQKLHPIHDELGIRGSNCLCPGLLMERMPYTKRDKEQEIPPPTPSTNFTEQGDTPEKAVLTPALVN